MELKHNPGDKLDIDEERERREERLAELAEGIKSSGDVLPEEDDDEEPFKIEESEELAALLPYYNQVEDEALKVAKKYFRGTFIADSKDVHNQKLFEFEDNGQTYRCYVDIYNENDDEINIIEVKATTVKKFAALEFTDAKPKARNANKYPLFIKKGNIWRLNHADSTVNDMAFENFKIKKGLLLNRFRAEGKYPHDLAFQKFVIENALREKGERRPVKFYLAVLNNDYIYDGARDDDGNRIYNKIDGQEIITFLDMNEIVAEYQPTINNEKKALEANIAAPHDISDPVDVGPFCDWGGRTECVFWRHCYQTLRSVPDEYASIKFIDGGPANWGKQCKGRYDLVKRGIYSMMDMPAEWVSAPKHQIQLDCIRTGEEHIDKDKMNTWFDKLEKEGPIYHFDFESFPCPLPRFRGEWPYLQSVFEFSLHIERAPGVCDKEKDNFIFLNSEFDTDEREALADAILEHFEFNADGTLKGTMLAQNTSFEKGRLTELAQFFPDKREKLLAIRDKSADLIHLLKTSKGLYMNWNYDEERSKTINYYNRALNGSYSIKKTLPVLVPSLSYDDMKKHTVGNGVQAYATYINYDAAPGTTRDMNTKEERRESLRRYCQQDTWAMVEILRSVRKKIAR